MQSTSTMRAAGDNRPLLRLGVFAGIGGIVFAGIVVLQNVVFATAAPANDAAAADIVEFFRDRGTLVDLLFGTLPLADIALLAWAAGIYVRTRHAAPGAMMLGLLGVVGILSMFTSSTAVQLAMAARIDTIAGDDVLVETLWAVHNGAFTTAIFFIGVAQLGIALAAVEAGLAPRWFRYTGIVGGLLMMLATVPAVAMTDTAMTLPAALPGFALWLLLVAWTGFRLLTSEEPAS